MAELQAKATMDSTGFSQGARKMKSDLADVTGATAGFNSQLSGLGGRLAGVFSVAAIGAFVMKMGEVAHSIEEISSETGLTVPQVGKLRQMAAAGGQDFEQFDRVLRKVTASLSAAKAGGVKEIETLSSLGMAIADIPGASLVDVLTKIGTVMRDSGPDSAEMKAVWDELGTRVGPKMRDMLIYLASNGFGKLDESLSEHVQKVNEARKVWTSFKEDMTTGALMAAAAVIPIFQDFWETIKEGTKELGKDLGKAMANAVVPLNEPKKKKSGGASGDWTSAEENMLLNPAPPIEGEMPLGPIEETALYEGKGPAVAAAETAAAKDAQSAELRKAVLGKQEEKVNELTQAVQQERRESMLLGASYKEINAILAGEKVNLDELTAAEERRLGVVRQIVEERKAAIQTQIDAKLEEHSGITGTDITSEKKRLEVEAEILALEQKKDKVDAGAAGLAAQPKAIERQRAIQQERRESEQLGESQKAVNAIIEKRSALLVDAIATRKGETAIYDIERSSLNELIAVEEKRLGIVRSLVAARENDLQAQIDAKRREKAQVTGPDAEKKRLDIEDDILELRRKQDKVGEESDKREEDLKAGKADIDVQKAKMESEARGEKIPADAMTKIGATTFGRINPGFSAASRAEQIQSELLKINQEQLQVMRQLSLGLK